MGVEELQNMLVRVQGAAIRRPGTEYVVTISEEGESRLIPFEYSTDDTYVLRFSDEKLYFLRTVSGEPGEIEAP